MKITVKKFFPYLLYGVTITPPISSRSFEDLLKKIGQGIGPLIASLGTIMLIVAGILYLLSGGSQERMATAKKALVYAIIGIAVGAAASAIVTIILDIIK